MNDKYRLPSIDLLDDEYIDNIYVDFMDRKIHMVNFHGTSMLVNAFDLSADRKSTRLNSSH